MSKAAAKKEILKALRLNKYIPFAPTAKQILFLIDKSRDVFFGGAAGGAKSWALLMAALQYVDVPRYNALILRDTYSNLNKVDSIMDVSHQWLDSTDANWSEKDKRWEFPAGSTLTFGYLERPRDHLNYKGPRFQYIGIDEAGDLRWKQVIYMFSRLGKDLDIPVPLRFRLASNPGGRSHNELKARYIDPETRGERVFISSKLTDNPHIEYESYVENLMELDPITRAQLLNGDWEIRESGRMFDRSWFQIIETLPKVVESVRYWDIAATEVGANKDPDYTVGTKISRTKTNQYIVESVIRMRETSFKVEQVVRQTAEMDGRGTKIVMEQEPGSAGKAIIDHYRRNVLAGYVFYADKVTGSKESRAMPFASQAEAGNVFLLKGGWIPDYLDEFDLFPDGSHDDQVDSSSGAFTKLAENIGDYKVRYL